MKEKKKIVQFTAYKKPEPKPPQFLFIPNLVSLQFPMSEEDFELLVATLNLWKNRMVSKQPEIDYEI